MEQLKEKYDQWFVKHVIIAFLVIFLLMIGGIFVVKNYYQVNQIANAANTNPAQTTAVVSLNPTKIAFDGQERTVLGAPDHLQRGDMISFVINNVNDEEVIYDSQTSAISLSFKAGLNVFLFGTFTFFTILYIQRNKSYSLKYLFTLMSQNINQGQVVGLDKVGNINKITVAQEQEPLLIVQTKGIYIPGIGEKVGLFGGKRNGSRIGLVFHGGVQKPFKKATYATNVT